MNEGEELYQPESDFLCLVINEQVPLSGHSLADANLSLLIDFTRDTDKSNRDWAIFLLAQTEFDTPEIRAAFKHALEDKDEDVRAEALVGIAKRDPAFALPLVAEQLSLYLVNDLAMEAASYVADASLLPALTEIRDHPDNAGVVHMFLDDALESCATGIQPEWRDFKD